MNGIAERKLDELQKLLVLNRIRILEVLYKKETCVCKMVSKLDMKHSLISHHLKTLVDIGYLESDRHGQHIVYKLVDSRRGMVGEILTLIHKKS